jgi:hypothetical protein
MRSKLQLGTALLATISWAGLPAVVSAQKVHNDRPPQAQPSRPAPSHTAAQPHAQSQPRNPSNNSNRPPSNANRPPANAYRPPSYSNPNQNNRPQNSYNNLNNGNRYRNGQGQNAGINRNQPGVNGQRSWVDTMRNLTPSEREHVFQSSQAFQNLSPDKQNRIRQQFSQWDHMTAQQRADQRIKEDNWRKLTPDQRDYIRNNIAPRWRQMPWDRQQAMKQKLGILQNMPESARNQRLNDPNFTRGMSDDERSMLHDLAHMHVGGAPESPVE